MFRKMPCFCCAPKSTSMASTMWSDASFWIVMSDANRRITQPSSAEAEVANASQNATKPTARAMTRRIERLRGIAEVWWRGPERKEAAAVGDRRQHDRRRLRRILAECFQDQRDRRPGDAGHDHGKDHRRPDDHREPERLAPDEDPDHGGPGHRDAVEHADTGLLQH